MSETHNKAMKYITDAIMFEKSIINDDLPTMLDESRLVCTEDVINDLRCRSRNVNILMEALSILEELKESLDSDCTHPSTGKANNYCPDCGDKV